jgi:heme exporter protein A
VPLWLLDEPFAALDASAAALLEGLLTQHVAQGGAVVYTTHQATGMDAAARVIEL